MASCVYVALWAPSGGRNQFDLGLSFSVQGYRLFGSAIAFSLVTGMPLFLKGKAMAEPSVEPKPMRRQSINPSNPRTP